MIRSFTLSAVMLMGFLAHSQDFEFFHSLGGSYIYVIDTESILGAGQITYSPRLNLYNFSKTSSLSIGANPGISFRGTYSSRVEGGSNMAYDLPITSDFNFGHMATKRSRSDFGGFVGAGYALTSIKSSLSGNNAMVAGESQSSTHGFYSHLGARFSFRTQAMRKARIPETSLTSSLFALLGSNGVNVFGLRILYNFDQ